MSKSYYAIFIFAFFYVIGAFAPMHAHALSVDQLRVGTYPDKTRLVLELSQAADFRAFVLDSPYRLVVDLPQFNWNAGNFSGSAKAGISALRSGTLKPGVSRLVFDLNRPASIGAAFTLPSGDGNAPDRLVIDFANASAQKFQTEKSRVFGSLDVDNPAHIPQASQQNLLTANATTGALPVPPQKPATQPKVKPLIVIDPGHGGVDPGAVGHNNLKEKTVVLALAKELKSQLESSGRYRVILTRDNDKFIKLSHRVKFARDHNADLFISIHADSIGRSNVRGASIYTLSEKASDAQTEKLAARENRADLIAGIDLSVEDEDVANILVDLAMRDTTNQAKFLANTVVGKFDAQGLKMLENPHRYAGFAVLKAPDIPSVLIETGFMSNRHDAELLNTSAHRRKVAGAILRGIDAYFEQVRKNQRL